ncbi:MAG: NADP-dependent isocitrate dehydrogenase, partial [Pseudomonadota bacterium]
MPDIIYTKVDEAPELASASLLPIIRKFAAAAGVSVGTKDISLAGRILAAFPDHLSDDQRQSDDLAELGRLVKMAEANVIKLPNISASVPQLVGAIKELQSQGFALPDYPEAPSTDAEKTVRAKYDAVKGSAVNPVLREGNSDRRAAKAVKSFAQANPHRMGKWTADSKTHVSSMSGNDFFSNETSATLRSATGAKIVLETAAGETVLKDGLEYPAGTVVDATFMSVAALKDFLAAQIDKTKDQGILFSLHLKATMMKVSDPILFGHAVKAFLAPVFEKHGDAMAALGVNPNSGLGDLLARVKDDASIMADIDACMASRPPMYMVDSDKGIT